MKKSVTSESFHEKHKFFGHELPNESKTGLSLDFPIKVIASEKYVEAEVKVITAFLNSYDTVAWDVLKNYIVVVGEKKIECYEILISDWTDDSKESFTVNFYFDITDCIDINADLMPNLD